MGLQDGKPYFVTELLQGESLRERLAKGPIPLGKALEWAAQMAQGLAAAHERGIVHRDLKPENVFITRDGHVKLLDFGIAKLIETAQAATPHGLMEPTVSPSGSSTGTGMVLGTPGYMSPEQVRGDPVDARTDFFSLGAVLYEMLSGRRAFPAGPVVESGYAILHNEPDLLQATVPPLVAQVVHRCLDKDPARRFQSARDLAFNLELVRSPTGSSAPAATAPGLAAQTNQRRLWWLPVAATLAVLVGAGATYLLMPVVRTSTPSVEQITFRLGRVSDARFNPEGRVVFSASWDGQPLEIFSRAPGSADIQPLGLRDVRLLAVSANGELAVLLHPRWVDSSERGTLALVSGSGGAPREVAENVEEADWSPTGELAVVRAVGGKRQLEFPLGTPLFEGTSELYNPRVSPRGDYVAVWYDQDILVLDRKGHSVKLATLVHTVGFDGLAWAPSGAEVWFSNGNALSASSLSGKRRLVYQGLAAITLEDISRGGTVLLRTEDLRVELAFLPQGKRERRLSWLGENELAALSDDGQRVLFTSFPNGDRTSYLRPTDGAPPVKLGRGGARAVFPNGEWVLSVRDGHLLSQLPVGAGAEKAVSVVGVEVYGSETRVLRDGKRFVFTGLDPKDEKVRLYVMPLEGGTPARISDAALTSWSFEVSRDDKLVAAKNVDEILTLFPIDGGQTVSFPDLGKDVVPVGWTADGHLWVQPGHEIPARILRYDIHSRRVLEERLLAPSDLGGVTLINHVRITPDGRAMAFDYWRHLTYLYLVDGLGPPRR